MAALVAARNGRQVFLLEKMEQPGRKLRITGKGRCNLTNTADIKGFLAHIGPDARFMRNSFSFFFNKELMEFFESLGGPLVVERGDRVYPRSGKSLDIFLALVQELERLPNVTIRKSSRVASLIIEDGAVAGVLMADRTTLRAERVIVATGGMSYPLTGSTGDGYRFASSAGHSITPQVPALVRLVSDIAIPDELVGFVLKNVKLTLTRENSSKICEHFGEMMFSSDGIDGPIVLSASRTVSRLLHNGEKVIAHIDFKPAVESSTLDHRLIDDLNGSGTRLFHDALRIWMPAELVPLALKSLHIEYYKRLNQINSTERKRLLAFLKDFQFPITDTGGFEEAIITQGGINTKELNPKTMESRLVRGLHFAGEVIDIDADTGGYNLQIAFSTGYVAGMAC